MKPLVLAAALLAAAPAPSSPPAAPTVRVAYQAGQPANFFWLVNALAGDAHTSTAAFRAYWRTGGFARPGDEAALAAFRRVRDRYAGDYLRDGDEPPRLVPVTPRDGDLRQKFQALFLSSGTMDEVWAKAEVLLTEDDRDALRGVFAHFRPDFDRHWKAAGHLAAYRDRFARFADGRGLPAMLGRAAGFLGVPAGAALDVRVIFLFTPTAKHTYGRAVGPNLVVEVPAGQAPEDQVDVVVHELCHHFFDRGGVEQDPAFMQAVFGSGARHAGPTWSLLNEGLATAIGQGVAAERLAPQAFARTRGKPLGWYAEPRIDAFAQALFPAVKQAMAAGGTYRTLAPAFLDAYAGALGHAADDPKAYLASYALIDGNARRQGFARYFELVPPRSVWHARFGGAARMLGDYPAQTVVVAATAQDLPRVREELAAYHLTAAQLDALQAHERALLVVRRPANGYVFFVYGRDAGALDEAMARFGALPRFAEGLAPL